MGRLHSLTHIIIEFSTILHMKTEQSIIALSNIRSCIDFLVNSPILVFHLEGSL